MKVRRRITATLLAVSLAGFANFAAAPGIASGGRPPAPNPALLPPGAPAAPLDPTETKRNTPCPRTQAAGTRSVAPAPQRALAIQQAWQFSRGAGQVVAVIDTGVAPHNRLTDLRAGGDYVAAGGDGLADCDVHGTVVAGIIAATPSPEDAFAGVAPDAAILSIRQTSNHFQRKDFADRQPGDFPMSYGNIDALARAIVRAADHGATVINISLVLCQPGAPPDGPLAAALQYAADVHDVVIVAAAGNKGDMKKKGEPCTPSNRQPGGKINPGVDPVNPQSDLWNRVNLNVTPARHDDYVLSVGSINAEGQPSAFTVPGPWLGVAAPGEGIVSLDPTDKDGLTSGKGGGTLQGTSFAAPYVAGLAALVRARFPDLSAREVIKRIEATAHAPAEGWNPYIGYGTIDPVAALTHEVPAELPPKRPHPARNVQLALPAPPPPPDHTARNVALIGSGVVAGALLLGYLASFPIRRYFGTVDSKSTDPE